MFFLKEIYWAVCTKVYYYIIGTFFHKFLISFWELFSQLWFFLFAGIALSALLSVFWNAEKVSFFLKPEENRICRSFSLSPWHQLSV